MAPTIEQMREELLATVQQLSETLPPDARKRLTEIIINQLNDREVDEMRDILIYVLDIVKGNVKKKWAIFQTMFATMIVLKGGIENEHN